MQVTFFIIRQKPNDTPRGESFTLEVQEGNTILDCLNQIKWELDGTLAFRKNCRNTICGSCAIRINGRAALACQQTCKENLLNHLLEDNTSTPTITIAPLGNLPVIKDLIVDMSAFWDDLEKIQPYVSTESRKVPEREFLQSPQEREKLNQTGNCIMCGACYSECNAKEVNPDFVGPHALAKAERLLTDSRDHQHQARLEDYSQGIGGVWGCTRCYMCSSVCPMGVEPMEQITKIKQEILHIEDTNTSPALRHRKVLINLVRQAGWIDERKFGLMVVGNYFKDWRGLFSLLPLGWHMAKSGKFPTHFEASEGTKEVRGIIDSVKGEQ